jgi:hypothetical protein
MHRATMCYMAHPLSVRLNDATIVRLGRHAQRAHLAPRTLAQRYVEEGLRMDEHPLIRFADGPAGRRARLVGTGATTGRPTPRRSPRAARATSG